MSTDDGITERLSRREAMVAAGALGLGAGAWALLRGGGTTAAAATSARAAAARCVLAPELTEGPYYIAEHLVRRDVTEGQAGTPLELRLTVEREPSCAAIANATIEIWHANAEGQYSGYDASGSGTTGAGSPPSGGGGGGGHATPTSATHYLRGAQRTDRNGLAVFDTVYPGWYRGRAPHIHLKVHVRGKVVHIGQLFFKDRLNAAVYATGAYASRGQPDTTDATDSIYAAGGSRSMPAMRATGGGYVGAITLGVKA
jgi:protocatechuate 3,4-dioxygenase beta subunit